MSTPSNNNDKDASAMQDVEEPSVTTEPHPQEGKYEFICCKCKTRFKSDRLEKYANYATCGTDCKHDTSTFSEGLLCGHCTLAYKCSKCKKLVPYIERVYRFAIGMNGSCTCWACDEFRVYSHSYSDYSLNLNYFKDPRDVNVLACVRSSEHSYNYDKMHAERININDKWVKVKPNLPAEQDRNNEEIAGYILGNIDLPVYIYFSYWKAKTNGKYVVYWGISRRYGDDTMMEEYVRLRFVNCKMFTDNSNQYGILSLFQ